MKNSFMAVFICTGLGALPAALPLATGAARAEAGAAPRSWTVQAETDSKQDRKTQLLAKLTRQLGAAKDGANAKILAGTIRKLWRETDSPTISLLMERVSALITASEREPAIAILDSIVEIAPEYAEGWFVRAVLLFQMNELGRALHDVGQALDLNPDHFDALRQLGLILNRLGDRNGALNAYQRAQKVYPLLPGISDAIRTLNDQIKGRAI